MTQTAILSTSSAQENLTEFLARNDIAAYRYESVGADMAPRQYYRLHVEGREKTIVLCVGPSDNDPSAHPGHLIRNTVRLTKIMEAHGVRVPAVYDAVPEWGFVLLEDFGDMRLDQAIEQGLIDGTEAYGIAAEVSNLIQDITCDDDLPEYYQSHVHAGRSKLVEWYLPLLLKQKTSTAQTEEYLRIWYEVERQASPQKLVFSHIDFHLMNLMYLSDEQGTNRCGVLDFQGAMRASYAYDLVNLLGDARRLVDPAIVTESKARFTANMNDEERLVFEDHYAILSAQFHSRCLGQFLELAFKGKGQYLQYIPDLLKQFKADMDTPLLKPVKDWLDAQGMDFDHPITMDEARDKEYISTLL